MAHLKQNAFSLILSAFLLYSLIQYVGTEFNLDHLWVVFAAAAAAAAASINKRLSPSSTSPLLSFCLSSRHTFYLPFGHYHLTTHTHPTRFLSHTVAPLSSLTSPTRSSLGIHLLLPLPKTTRPVTHYLSLSLGLVHHNKQYTLFLPLVQSHYRLQSLVQ